MADWYISSAAWALIAQFAASTAYTVGQIVRPLTAPAASSQYAFRCTTAGTSSTEPTWPAANNATVTTGGATFTNVSGQSTYGWSAAAGNLYSMASSAAGSNRVMVGDRAFLSSDHLESIAASVLYEVNGVTQAFGVTQIISVNRAGNVPPQATDALSGATLETGSFEQISTGAYCSIYWQGITINSGEYIYFGQNGVQKQYLRNCTLTFNSTAGWNISSGGSHTKLTLDNTVINFTGTGQSFNANNGNMEIEWINTPSALLGTVPTALFTDSNSLVMLVAMRGVDVSALTTALLGGLTGAFTKLLLDSCKIASGVARTVSPTAGQSPASEIELVNCYDGTHFLSERHNAAGDLTTDRTTYMTGGAADDYGSFAHKLISSANADDFVLTLDTFWLDVENTLTGASHTATVELVSSGTLNINDLSMYLEYLGTSGSTLASFTNSFPNALTASSAIASSTASWNSPPSTPVYQHIQISFTPQEAGRLRGQLRLGKPSTTVWINPQIAVT